MLVFVMLQHVCAPRARSETLTVPRTGVPKASLLRNGVSGCLLARALGQRQLHGGARAHGRPSVSVAAGLLPASFASFATCVVSLGSKGPHTGGWGADQSLAWDRSLSLYP